MRLIILTQYYPPEIGAPQNRLSDIARRFVRAGHQVTVLTAMPNYPTGKVLPGYGGFFRREVIDGVQVLRSFIYPTQSAGLIKRLANYFSFTFSSALIGSLFLPKADFLLCESPPLFLGPSAIWLSWLKCARFIFNVSDLWPESALHVGVVSSRESLSYRVAEWLEARCYRSAWTVSGQSRAIIQNIHQRFPRVATYHLSNGVDTDRFSPRQPDASQREPFGAPDDLVVMYAGLHGLAQGLQQILLIAERLRDSPNIRFVFVGDGPVKRQLMDEAAQRGLSNVKFMDPIPSARMPSTLICADVLIVPLKSYIPGAVPSKLYEAMACGRPVLLIASGEAAQVVEQANAGAAIAPDDIDAAVDCLRKYAGDSELRRQLGENGRRYVMENFNRATIASGLIEHLQSALSDSGNESARDTE